MYYAIILTFFSLRKSELPKNFYIFFANHKCIQFSFNITLFYIMRCYIEIEI